MSSTPFISILIPVANGAEYLFESLSSVIQQTYPHWECIIALNGEGLQGPAAAVAAAFDDPRIRILSQHPTISTKVAALNDAVQQADPKAEWIALLDVDDRWHPEKLAQQVAAIQDDIAVIGTFAEYFGEFKGTPKIPAGNIDPRSLVSLNPIINSSAIIRRAYAKWSYFPSYPDSMEDYYMWMVIILGGNNISNISTVLTYHRIHKSSAFNARNESPATLQQWFSEKLRTYDTKHIIIMTTVCNSPHFIRAQYAALRRYVQQPWSFIVFNDAKDWPDSTNFGDPTMRKQIEDVCRELGSGNQEIRCIPIANQGHRHIQSASQRHCDTLRKVMDFVHMESPPGRFWMLDSDMWPIDSIDNRDMDRYFLNAGTFVQQTRQHIVYAWPNLWWLDTAAVDSRDLCWDLAPACDTGGASAPWIARHQQSIRWLAPHKSSCTWGFQHIPPSLLGHASLRSFLEADPRNATSSDVAVADVRFWAELYDDRIFHVRAGSNWNGEGVGIHRRIAELVTTHFA